jgi:hypothetical protein
MISLFARDERTLVSKMNERREHRKCFPDEELEFDSKFLTALETDILLHLEVPLIHMSLAIPVGWSLGARRVIVDAVCSLKTGYQEIRKVMKKDCPSEFGMFLVSRTAHVLARALSLQFLLSGQSHLQILILALLIRYGGPTSHSRSCM